MNKDDILGAVIAIGDAVRAAKRKQEIHQKKQENLKKAVDAGYPVGKTVFNFCYLDGIQVVEVVGEKTISVDGLDPQPCLGGHVLSDTVDGAISCAVDRWAEDGDIDETIEDFEARAAYHKGMMENFEKALECLKAHKST